MSNNIGWCDCTINPVVGCTKCSPGCANCYAEKFAARLARNPKTAKKYAGVVDERGRWTGKISEPDWSCFERLPKAPRRVFVGSMTDIFIDPCASYLPKLFYNMTFMPQHTFLLLTKRPENIPSLFDVWGAAYTPSNIWLGVTICNQEEAIDKIPTLLDTPAAKRFLSIEPMLGPVDLTRFLPGLDWVICGGESGFGARPMHSDWVRLLRASCLVAGVPFYFKGWGEWLPCSEVPDDMDVSRCPMGDIGDDGIFIPPPALEIPMRNGVCHEDTFRVGKNKSGHLLDGREWREFPAQEVSR